MTATKVGLRHEVGPHHTTVELLAELTPAVRGALTRAEYVETVLEPSVEAALRVRLGDLARRVTFRSPADIYDCYSPQAIATTRRRDLAELTRTGPCTLVEQFDCPVDGARLPTSFWAELDETTRAAFAGLPVTLVRPGWQPSDPTAPHLRVGEISRYKLSPARYPSAALATPAPPIPTPPDRELEFGLAELRALRAEMTRFARQCDLDPELTDAMVIAVGEVTTNSVEHGAGRGTLRLWADVGELTVEVHDSGLITDPHLGLCPPDPRGMRGRGLWMARQLSNVMHVWVTGSGTSIRQTFRRASARRSN